MLDVLHVAHSRQVSEGKVERLRREPDLRLHLVRPHPGAPPRHDHPRHEAHRGDDSDHAIHYDGTTRVPVWRRTDPHRCLYGTVSFGLRRIRPAIIHVEEEPDSLAALQVCLARRVYSRRACLVFHTWQNVRRSLAPGVRALVGLTLRAADAILCASDEAERVARALGFRGTTGVILPQGVDVGRFIPSASSSPPGEFSVGYVGRLVPEKGCATLLEAVALLGAPARLTLIGDGPDRPALAEQAAALGLAGRVRFTGPLPPDAVPAAMTDFDVVVLPSRTTAVWKEQFGRVLAEAMACAIPVVGSDSGAIPAVIADAGLVFPEGNAAALADCLRALRENPSRRGELGRRGHERAVDEFSEVRLAERTAAFYRELAGIPAGGLRTTRGDV